MPSTQKRKSKKKNQTSSPSKITWVRKQIGVLLIVLGIVFLITPRLLSHTQSVEQPPQEPIRPDISFAVSSPQLRIPKKIIIPSVSIDLTITPAKLVRGVWETSDSTASFGEGSSEPGNGSNTVIFAHAREGLFHPLKEVSIGDTIYLLTDSQHFSYSVESLTEVLPSDVFTIRPTEDERLTLFTCSGFLDSKRLVVVAKPLR